MAALASTGGLYALADRSDAGHEAATQSLRQLGGALVALGPVLTEAVDLASRLLGPDAGDALLEATTNGDLLFQPLEQGDWAAARLLQRSATDLSLTGALVVTVAERLGVEAVLCLEPGIRRAARSRGLQALPEGQA